jgi:hypothetical protein
VAGEALSRDSLESSSHYMVELLSHGRRVAVTWLENHAATVMRATIMWLQSSFAGLESFLYELEKCHHVAGKLLFCG